MILNRILIHFDKNSKNNVSRLQNTIMKQKEMRQSLERHYQMQSYVQAQRERKGWLRQVQRSRRAGEKNLNLLERQIQALLSRKRLISYPDAKRLNETFDLVTKDMTSLYQKLLGFSKAVQI